MSAELAVKIVQTEQAVTFDVGGRVVPVYRVRFTVGAHGPFTEDFTAADFIPETVKQRTEKIATTLRSLC